MNHMRIISSDCTKLCALRIKSEMHNDEGTSRKTIRNRQIRQRKRVRDAEYVVKQAQDALERNKIRKKRLLERAHRLLNSCLSRSGDTNVGSFGHYEAGNFSSNVENTMHTCVCVCLYVCVYVCMCVCLCVYVCMD